MKKRILRHISLLLLGVYLCGGHAAAHGFSWCLDGGESAHLERNFGVCANAAASSCAADVACAVEVADAAGHAAEHGPAECRHLPYSAPHRTSFSQTAVPANENPAPLALPAAFTSPAATVTAVPLPHRHAALLPPLQVLAALRHIVLTC